ncbi:GNAT family N-acetyltransferase [Jiella avicenniae]|uniref:GNAT family N-acetyltransferase n=1 Tax=Jiella avicenniae TaxID=2907202 RepID=A0A9X1NZC7_9HYPH|nr:GNAT family N-acetyltransferase [Jiella avicenniae]MCE7026496.1 GNAT family N-acetyltransferase [Jiella avicenniae]
MATAELCWRVEEACRNARPSPVEIEIDGWLLRAAGGPVRRINCVSPPRRRAADPVAILPEVEAIYAKLGRPAIFRVPSLVRGIDAPLEERGYGLQAPTRVLYTDLARRPRTSNPAVELVDAVGEDWIAAFTTIGAASAEAVATFRQSVGCIVLPKRFAGLRIGDSLAAIAYGVIHRGLMVVEAVATHPAHRQRGHAGAVLDALMSWAVESGARGACLAVVSDNEPALALYRSLGFRRELYRYHYRRNDIAT